MDENVLLILRLEVEVEVAVEVDAHPGGREQLRPCCGSMMPGVLPQNNVAPVVEGRHPTRAYQPLGVVLEPLAYESSLLPTSLHISVYKQGMYCCMNNCDSLQSKDMIK
jgi:hypothetical protein